jgi:hypothetical protein
MKRCIPIVLLVVLVFTAAAATGAQSQCAALIQQALALVAQNCADAGRNQACHGYLRAEAQPRAGVPAFSFDVGQTADLSQISALETSPFDEQNGIWGVALLRVQANLPNEMPGTNATFLLMGAASLENDDAQAANPMQAVRLRTGLSGTTCTEAPSDGLLIQTPHGVGRVELTINGAAVSLGSTVFFEARPGESMTISTVEGSAQVSAGGVTETALPGQSISVPMTVSMEAAGAPSAPQPYDAAAMHALPLGMLERPVTLPSRSQGNGQSGSDALIGNCGNGQGQGVANGCNGGQGSNQNGSDPSGSQGNGQSGSNAQTGNCGNGQGQGVANGCNNGQGNSLSGS